VSGQTELYCKPDIHSPYLLAAWPGIGNIGLIAINYLKNALVAEEFGRIQPWEFFSPKDIIIKDGVLLDVNFPAGKFYYKKAKRDLIIFLAEAQPNEEDEIYDMANLVLDVAAEFGCQRVYTAGAAVSSVHHTAQPRVWAVPNKGALLEEVRTCKNTILMSDLDDRTGGGNITGLNGVLLGVAQRRKMEGICFLGEVPMYIAHFPGPYTIPHPKASKIILETLTENIGLQINMSNISAFANNVEREIEGIYQNLPAVIREELDKLKHIIETNKEEIQGPITDEEKEKIIREVEDFFKKGGKHDD